MLLPIVLLVAILLGAFITLDKLLKFEYERFPSEWLKDSGPVGFFWQPDETNLRSTGGRYNFLMSFLFQTPDWVKSSQEALGQLQRFRMLILTWVLGSFACIILPCCIR